MQSLHGRLAHLDAVDRGDAADDEQARVTRLVVGEHRDDAAQDLRRVAPDGPVGGAGRSTIATEPVRTPISVKSPPMYVFPVAASTAAARTDPLTAYRPRSTVDERASGAGEPVAARGAPAWAAAGSGVAMVPASSSPPSTSAPERRRAARIEPPRSPRGPPRAQRQPNRGCNPVRTGRWSGVERRQPAGSRRSRTERTWAVGPGSAAGRVPCERRASPRRSGDRDGRRGDDDVVARMDLRQTGPRTEPVLERHPVERLRAKVERDRRDVAAAHLDGARDERRRLQRDAERVRSAPSLASPTRHRRIAQHVQEVDPPLGDQRLPRRLVQRLGVVRDRRDRRRLARCGERCRRVVDQPAGRLLEQESVTTAIGPVDEDEQPVARHDVARRPRDPGRQDGQTRALGPVGRSAADEREQLADAARSAPASGTGCC